MRILLFGIFGIGLKGRVNDFYTKLFTKVNESHACKVSIDIPSGIHSNDPFFTTAIKAAYTFTIQCPKLSSGLQPSKKNYGNIRVLDIGIPITSNPVFINHDIQYVNTTGNEALATGGSSDMLTSMLLGLLPQHKDITQGLINAVYLHGLTANLYKKNTITATLPLLQTLFIVCLKLFQKRMQNTIVD